MDGPPQMRLPLSGTVRAGSFIVTLFGDVVAPRGGEVGIRDIIAFCAPFGLSETLIRTAMSRLVAAGQVQGVRKGRLSFYALTDAARVEYAQAARRIYGVEAPAAWRFLCFPDGGAVHQVAALQAPGLVAISDHFALGPAHEPVPEGVLAFTAAATGAPERLRDMVARFWPLEALAERYAEVLDFAQKIAAVADPDPLEALALRVLLVHAYRGVALDDPRLAPEVLPEDWPGHRARRAFAEQYLRLTPAADSGISGQFSSASGPLSHGTAETRARQAELEALRDL
jgi:phenylacetic acid degradation operon negative regulatory protein